MKALHIIAVVLLIIGGLNWALVGLFSFDVVTEIIGNNIVTDIIFVLVGLSALYELFTHKANCAVCKGGKKKKKEGMDMPSPMNQE